MEKFRTFLASFQNLPILTSKQHLSTVYFNYFIKILKYTLNIIKIFILIFIKIYFNYLIANVQTPKFQ